MKHVHDTRCPLDAPVDAPVDATPKRQAPPGGGDASPAPAAKSDPLAFDPPFFQAGLAGYSDTAMRLIARRHGAAYCITEAMLDNFLLQGGKSLKHAELDPADHPIAGQLMGSEPESMAEASLILLDLDYDVIDLNFACPVKKVRRKHRGGHLLAEPDQAIAIMAAVRRAVGDRAPCTLKLRRGFDDEPGSEANFHRIMSAAIDLGFAGATVHGRTVEQKYLGPSRWAFLAALTRRYADAGFRLFGSGDVWTPADAMAMLRETGVEAVSVARGCIGDPWFFRQAAALYRGDEAAAGAEPTLAEQRAVLLAHFELSVKTHGEAVASRMMRKFGIKFARRHPTPEPVAEAFIQVRTLDDWRAALDRFYPPDGTTLDPPADDDAAASDARDAAA